jgi:glycosyltransferase involved in cell wall biosynthesis
VTRVLQVLYSGLGGHGSVAFSLAEAAYDANAWASDFLFVGVEPVLDAYTRKCARMGTVHRHVRTTAGRPWAAWPRLYRMLGELCPDAIVLHSVKAILPVALFARRRNIPVIAVEHQPNALKSRAEWWVSRWLMRFADGVVLLTPEYQTELKEALGIKWAGEKVQLIENGIDTNKFRPSHTTARVDQRRLIGMAARMTSKKRQDLLVTAISQLVTRDGGDLWQLSLAGDGECMDELRSQVDALGLGDVVSFPGYLGESALRDWFRTLDFYAHASDGETLSTSILQALAMGLPVVGSDVPGIGNLLSEEGGVGLAVTQEPQAFADAFVRLRDDADLAASLGKRARALAVNRYSQANMFRQYRDLLERLCAR